MLCNRCLAPRRLASDRCTPGLVWPLRLPGAYIQEDVDGCRGLRQQAEVLNCESQVDDEGYRIRLPRSAHTFCSCMTSTGQPEDLEPEGQERANTGQQHQSGQSRLPSVLPHRTGKHHHTHECVRMVFSVPLTPRILWLVLLRSIGRLWELWWG